MNEFSKEVIEIGEEEYSLFVNRKVIIAWEKFCASTNREIQNLAEKYKNINLNEDIEIDDGENPFDKLEEIDNFEDDKGIIRKTYKKLFWLMLYTEHKLPESKCNELYDKACEEYGEENVIALENQMVEDANKDLVSTKQNLKNLKALRPKK